MKYIRQFLIILAISFIGELLKYVLPLPIPASIYGMAILFVCLMTGWIKLEAVKETGKFLIEIMPLMFIPAGVVTSLCTVFVLSKIMGLTHEDYVTMLPKSITTAIGMGVSEELGGYVTITVAVIIVTGVLGNIFGELVCKIFRITEPISKGLAFGSASHAIGTAKAIEIGEVEGAMSSLAIAVSGILTVVLSSLFAHFM